METTQFSPSPVGPQSTWAKNRKAIGVCVGALVLAGFILNAIFNPIPEEGAKEDPARKEAYDAGIVYGNKAGEMARANGKRVASLSDTDADQMRTLTTGPKFDAHKGEFIKGFKEGYEIGNSPR